MQQTSAVQKKPGEKPALAPSATQNKPKAPSSRMIPIEKLKHPSSQHKETNAADQSTRGEAAANLIFIRDTPSPPQRTGLTTPATQRATQHMQASAEMAGRRPGLLR